jgi:hypothetical protein
MDEAPAQAAPVINIDLGPLVAVMQQILDALNPTVWVPQAVDTVGQTLYSSTRALFLTLWNGVLLGIPHAMSDQFGPVVALLPPPGAIAGAGLVLALALLGIRTYAMGITGRGAILDELLARIIKMVAILSLLPWLISTAIDVENAIAEGIAVSSINNVMSSNNPPPAAFDVSLVIGWLIMLGLGIRLWLKLLSNVIHVMVAIVWSPIALVCGFIPESSWVTQLWTREFFGRLVGAALATIATGLGLAFALSMNGLLVTFGTAAAFLAAADLIDWLTRSPGTSVGGVLGRGLEAGAGLVAGGGAPSAAAQAAQMRSFASQQAAVATQRFYSYD